MGVMKILEHTAMTIGKPVKIVTDINSVETQELIDNMIITSYNAGGYGLAAPQVGIDLRIFIYRKNSNSKVYKVVINPKVLFVKGKCNSKNEGCLSVPGILKSIKRYRKFSIICQNRYGKEIKINTDNKLVNIILQHEFDHLMGLTILNR